MSDDDEFAYLDDFVGFNFDTVPALNGLEVIPDNEPPAPNLDDSTDYFSDDLDNAFLAALDEQDQWSSRATGESSLSS